ncbi:MAG: hypothetical protein JW731_15175, partial [Bacteroidales bacterium]|nr:hypothetical protein [Bacteroidales bacterium]
MYKLITFIIPVILLSGCINQPANITGEIYGFDLQAIARKNEATCKIEENGKFQQRVLIYKPTQGQGSLPISEGIPEGSWGKAKYLICEVYHSNPYSALLNFEFYNHGGKEKGIEVSPDSIQVDGKDEPRITVLIGVLPYMRSKVVLPLSFLDGQKIFLSRFPGQQKGYVSGHRIATENIGSVKLRLGPFETPGFMTTIEISSISLTNELPESYTEIDKPIVDRFGQWIDKDWTGKISTEAELTERMRKLERDVSNSSYPGNWSKYGGWKEKKF